MFRSNSNSSRPIHSEVYGASLQQLSVIIKTTGFIAFLAISIASMGLLGMVVYTTETKLKEVGIRKVLGANEGSLVYLLSKDFAMLLTLSALVALPVSYLLFDKIILVNFAYYQAIGWAELLTGAIAIGLLSFLIVSSHALKAARSNPAKVLKSE